MTCELTASVDLSHFVIGNSNSRWNEMGEKYDVMVWVNNKGWETVLRAVSLICAEEYELRHPLKHVSICRSIW